MLEFLLGAYLRGDSSFIVLSVTGCLVRTFNFVCMEICWIVFLYPKLFPCVTQREYRVLSFRANMLASRVFRCTAAVKITRLKRIVCRCILGACGSATPKRPTISCRANITTHLEYCCIRFCSVAHHLCSLRDVPTDSMLDGVRKRPRC